VSEGTKTLAEQIAVEPVRATVVAECVTLVDSEVKAKGGVSGFAIKGAYATVKKIKPKFVPDVVDALLNDWLDKMEPFYGTWAQARTGTFAEFVTARSDDVAEALLTVTDDRAKDSRHKTAKKLYGKLRPSAKVNVAGAVPKLGALIESHLEA
jgi:hypothetical protein